jgi:hypothetical protein
MDESMVPRRRFRRRAVTLGLASIVAIAVVAGVLAWQRDDWFGTPIDAGTPAPPAASLPPADLAFYDYVGPRLRDVAAESQRLADLGRERSRNLIELQRRGDRVTELGQQIDNYAFNHPVPATFATAFQHYRAGIAAARRAMDETRAAFARFDWDRVAQAVTVMERGAANLSAASQLLERAAGVPLPGTPSIEPG